MRFAAPARALLREVPDSFLHALQHTPALLDAERARTQHASYATALREAGVRVEVLAADEACPDCCFVEDVALVLSDIRGIVTRPGAASRRSAGPPVTAALASGSLTLTQLEAPATLDGGDVLRAGARLFVGVSSRTNREGVAQLTGQAGAAGLSVVPVTLGQGLHLKSVVTLLDPGSVVLLRGALDAAPFHDAGLEPVVVDEPAGANVLALGARVLVSAAAPRTADALSSRGHDVRAVDVSELHKADGALTCLSLRVPPPGAWCV
jgi:dimethylargininase